MNVLEARRGYLPGPWDVLWSLSVEETFYLLFPLLCWLFGRSKLLLVILLSFVVLGPFGRTVFSHSNEIWQEKSYPGGTDAIALGCLTALLVSRAKLSRRALRICVIIGALLLVFILCCSNWAHALGLGKTGLDMTVLAIGTCLVIIAAAQTKWRAPRLLNPVLHLGQCSYEVYLTHMFVVLALFDAFVRIGKPLALIPILFVAVGMIAALLGNGVAQLYSEPMNRTLRQRWGDGADRLGSVINNENTGRPQSMDIQLTKLGCRTFRRSPVRKR